MRNVRKKFNGGSQVASRRKLAWLLVLTVGGCLLLAPGCKRSTHFRNADRDAYSILSEKACGPTWSLEQGYSIRPDARSRFHDPTCYTDPRLPSPAPQLYQYQLPGLSTPDAKPPALETPTADEAVELADATSAGHAPVSADMSSPFQLASSSRQVSEESSSLESSLLIAVLRSPDEALQEELPLPSGDAQSEAYSVKRSPIEAKVWESLPKACLQRMLEFESVREEYFESYGEFVDESQLDDARRVTLENILELSLINNREYQSRKETLYRVALRLSLERFQYDLRFFSRGNGTDVNYVHNRIGGIEVNTLRTPTTIGVTKSLYTAGELAARFANDVVLTFNGASGYSSRVGSEILVDLSQPLLQRDVRFEPLTQAERDVVYAARDYVRFRKSLFRDLAGQYYNLLLTYRSIAIDTQDYFSNLRGFLRAKELERIGDIPRFQVDQFEQNALASRGSLISSCNSLEGAIDRLKIAIGLPTELPINLDLSELEALTIRDEAAVVEEQILRKMQFVREQFERYGSQNSVTVAAELLRRLQNLDRLTLRLGAEDAIAFTDTLQVLLLQTEMEGSRIDAIEARSKLAELAGTDGLSQDQLYARIFDRNTDYLTKRTAAMESELELLVVVAQRGGSPEGLKNVRQYIAELNSAKSDFDTIRNEHAKIVLQSLELVEYLPGAIKRQNAVADVLMKLESKIVTELAKAGFPVALGDAGWAQLTQLVIDTATDILSTTSRGLVPVEADVDEAMLTALVQRLDLMNVRGELADAWRDVKYAGDNLRGILNIEASQSIRTRLGGDHPFDFTFDDSTTSLGLRVDTPLNRRAERNLFRLALINYNVALRNLQAAEDNIKLQIRDGIRSLELGRNQYEISVASAALAYERVVSTRLQLIAPGRSSVSARDVLEAQQAYTRSLSAVARQHIRYIIDRVDFFLDLEQLQVDEMLFWDDLRQEDTRFVPAADFPAANPRPYGSLPPGPWYSDCIRRMEQVPPGQAMIHRAPDSENLPPETAPSEPLSEAATQEEPLSTQPAQPLSGQPLSAIDEMVVRPGTVVPAEPMPLEITPSR